jgi:hypothetical protein
MRVAKPNKVYAEFFGLIHIWTVFAWVLPMSGGKAQNSSVLGRKDTAVGEKALAITGRTLVRLQGVPFGLDGTISGPFGNGISGMAFVFWKAAISHLPACFGRVSV